MEEGEGDNKITIKFWMAVNGMGRRGLGRLQHETSTSTIFHLSNTKRTVGHTAPTVPLLSGIDLLLAGLSNLN